MACGDQEKQVGGCLSLPSAVAAVPQLQAVKSPRLNEMEDQVQLIMLWSF